MSGIGDAYLNITRAQIELSSKCNFKCVTCRHGYCEYGQNLASDICDMLCVDIFPSLHTLELQGTGESLLNPRLTNVIEAAKTSVREITLITNASLLTQENVRQFIRANIQLVVSLDGADREIFSKHRPVGSFEKIKNNLLLISKLRDESINSSFSITVNMVLTKMNYNTIPDMIKLLSDLRVDYLFVSEVRECMPDKEAWESLNILNLSSKNEFYAMINRCNELAKSKGIGFSFNPNKKHYDIRKKVCAAPWKHIFVSANGDVSVCCELTKVFGNLHRNSLTEILSCKDLVKFRNDMLMGEYDNHCVGCCLPWGLPY